jgi:hypothetical protein
MSARGRPSLAPCSLRRPPPTVGQPARPKRLGGFYAPLGTRRAKPSPSKPTPPKPTSQRYIVVTDRCYCIVSRLPYFPLHFHVLRLFVGQERLIKLACVLGSADPVDQGLRPMNEIRAFGAATLARPGETLAVALPGEPRDVTMPIPLGDTADEVRCRLIADWVIPTMVRHVSLMNLLQLFTAAMLEQRVVVRSGNANALACVVMSLKPLVLPFILRGLFVPVLSGHLLDYLQAPVPFLMGVMEECGAGDWVLLDIDVGSHRRARDVCNCRACPAIIGWWRRSSRTFSKCASSPRSITRHWSTIHYRWRRVASSLARFTSGISG